MSTLVASNSATSLGQTAARSRLSRAGWGVVSAGTLPALPSTPTDWNAEGRRLAGEVASMWSKKYIFTIRDGGFHDGMFHYECLFSLPTKERPVPRTLVTVLFAFLRPVGSARPRLFFSFEESDLRQEWSILGTRTSGFHADRGQQKLSLRGSAFESYLDFSIREKEKVKSRGIDVKTAFEISRLEPPPACYEDKPTPKVERPPPLKEAESKSGPLLEAPTTNIVVQSPHSPLSTRARRRAEEEEEANFVIAGAMEQALKAANMYCDKVSPPSTLRELLSQIFDAADEESEGMMAHYEVARLMMATLPGFGLEGWDINQLLSCAQENDDGWINLQAFTKLASKMVIQLRERRISFRSSSKHCFAPVAKEGIEFCYLAELKETVSELMKIFEAKAAEDPTRGLYQQKSGEYSSQNFDGAGEDGFGGVDGFDGDQTSGNSLVAMKRKHCRDCVNTLIERISPQEGAMLLQMLPEDENGFLGLENLLEALLTLRAEALLNSVTGNDLLALRRHLVAGARAVGLDWTATLKIWKMKEILLKATELCLSRHQIHTLLSLMEPRRNGDVSVPDFLHVCIAIIPHMSNATIFQQTSERLITEHAHNERKAESERLESINATQATNRDHDDDDDPKPSDKSGEKEKPENVERTLLQCFALVDETRKPTPTLPPEVIFNVVFNGADAQVQSLGLDELELAGLLAEMVPDASGEVPYHDFVRRWVPIMFELREHPLLSKYLSPKAQEDLGIPEPDRQYIEEACPLLTPDMKKPATLIQPQPQPAASPGLLDPAVLDGGMKPTGSRRGSKSSASKTVKRRTSLSSRQSIESNEGSFLGERVPSKNSLHKKEAQLPPPGRGFARRVHRMQSQNALKEEAPMTMSISASRH